jgi:hypothetical protein
MGRKSIFTHKSKSLGEFLDTSTSLLVFEIYGSGIGADVVNDLRYPLIPCRACLCFSLNRRPRRGEFIACDYCHRLMPAPDSPREHIRMLYQRVFQISGCDGARIRRHLRRQRENSIRRSIQPIVLEAGVNVITWARSALHVNEHGLYALNPAPGRRIGTGLTMQMVSRHMIRPLNGMPSDDILDYAYAPGRLPHRISIVTPLDWEPEEDRAFTSLVTILYDKLWPPYGLVHIYDVRCNKWDIERVNYATSYELPVIRRTFSPEF